MEGARLGVDGCGWWCGWKMEGSETGCGRVWTGVWMEQGRERDLWDGGVDGGVDERGRCGWKMEGSETGCGRLWTVVWMEDGGETGCGAVWTGLWMEDGGERDWV